MAARVQKQGDLIASLQARVAELESLHSQQAQLIKQRDARIAEVESQHAQQLKQRDVRISVLEAKLASLKRMVFGRSSEKLSAEQLALWRTEQHEEIAAVEAELTALGFEPAADPEVGEKRHPRRPVELPRRLPRRREVLDVVGTCACGGVLHKIGEECTQTLEWVPGHAEVKELIRPKYDSARRSPWRTCRHE